MLDSSAHDQFVGLARARLAAGSGHDDVLGEFRQQGLHKIDCINVIQEATGLSHAEAKRLVHYSPVWADRRDGDEYVEELFWRALFIDCLVGRGQVNQPDDWAAECRERQQRARTQLQDLATDLPDEVSIRYRECMAQNLLGRAFAALVDAGQHHSVTDQYWTGLAAVAETLCLNELLGENEPAADADDFVHAAHLIRRLTTPS
jgi:hypothetical protein